MLFYSLVLSRGVALVKRELRGGNDKNAKESTTQRRASAAEEQRAHERVEVGPLG